MYMLFTYLCYCSFAPFGVMNQCLKTAVPRPLWLVCIRGAFNAFPFPSPASRRRKIPRQLRGHNVIWMPMPKNVDIILACSYHMVTNSQKRNRFHWYRREMPSANERVPIKCYGFTTCTQSYNRIVSQAVSINNIACCANLKRQSQSAICNMHTAKSDRRRLCVVHTSEVS